MLPAQITARLAAQATPARSVRLITAILMESAPFAHQISTPTAALPVPPAQLTVSPAAPPLPVVYA